MLISRNLRLRDELFKIISQFILLMEETPESTWYGCFSSTLKSHAIFFSNGDIGGFEVSTGSKKQDPFWGGSTQTRYSRWLLMDKIMNHFEKSQVVT